MKPRGKGKYKPEYRLKDIYKYYSKENTIEQFDSAFSDRTQLVVPYELFKTILEDYLKQVTDFIFEETGIFLLPMRLGEIKVEKKKMNISTLLKYKNLQLDYKIYNETGKKVYHLNEHRRGYRYKIKWDKSRSGPIKNKKIYSFIPTRTSKRRLAWILKNDFSKDYCE